MNKEIRFRGKPVNKQFGEWAKGYYLQDLDNGQVKHYIFNCPMQIEVEPETVNQFIGLTDKTARKAYVGDVFEDRRKTIRTIFQTPGGFAIEADPIDFGYGYQDGINPSSPLADQQNASWFEINCKIIGNIYDTPSPLK